MDAKRMGSCNAGGAPHVEVGAMGYDDHRVQQLAARATTFQRGNILAAAEGIAAWSPIVIDPDGLNMKLTRRLSKATRTRPSRHALTALGHAVAAVLAEGKPSK